MGAIKGPSALKEQLSELEQDISLSLFVALKRLGGIITGTELEEGLNFNGITYQEIYLNSDMEVIFRANNEEKDTLTDLFNENRILHWDVIYLLEKLNEVFP